MREFMSSLPAVLHQQVGGCGSAGVAETRRGCEPRSPVLVWFVLGAFQLSGLIGGLSLVLVVLGVGKQEISELMPDEALFALHVLKLMQFDGICKQHN
jgi:hypothetical protein